MRLVVASVIPWYSFGYSELMIFHVTRKVPLSRNFRSENPTNLDNPELAIQYGCPQYQHSKSCALRYLLATHSVILCY